jgi:DNA-binding PadR family transcriptional regulator
MIAAASTGYDLKQAFATTPLGVYQPSSGALCPALRRLERRGLLRTEPGQSQDHARSRRRYVYRITEQGFAAHTAWVRRPVDPATISRDLPLHLTRFVMMERTGGHSLAGDATMLGDGLAPLPGLRPSPCR